jgi:hypothetical protein
VAAAILAAALLAHVPSAHAFFVGPPCDGPTCVGHSPYMLNRDDTETCRDDAVDVPGSTVAGLGDGLSNSVTLRWSANCQANWARYNYAGNLGKAHFYVQTYDGHEEWPQGNVYTNMVDGTQLARVCVQQFTSPYDYSCSGWF